MTYQNAFAEIITDYLEEENLFDRDFTKLTGIGDNLVRKWIETKHLPSSENLIKIATYLNCSVDYLFGRSIIKKFSASLSSDTFAFRFSMLLKSRNITPYRLSKKIDVSASVMEGWKNGKGQSTSSLLLVADYFKVSMDYLLLRTDIK